MVSIDGSEPFVANSGLFSVFSGGEEDVFDGEKRDNVKDFRSAVEVLAEKNKPAVNGIYREHGHFPSQWCEISLRVNE